MLARSRSLKCGDGTAGDADPRQSPVAERRRQLNLRGQVLDACVFVDVAAAVGVLEDQRGVAGAGTGHQPRGVPACGRADRRDAELLGYLIYRAALWLASAIPPASDPADPTSVASTGFEPALPP
jgi:hypothetical protein